MGAERKAKEEEEAHRNGHEEAEKKRRTWEDMEKDIAQRRADLRDKVESGKKGKKDNASKDEEAAKYRYVAQWYPMPEEQYPVPESVPEWVSRDEVQNNMAQEDD